MQLHLMARMCFVLIKHCMKHSPALYGVWKKRLGNLLRTPPRGSFVNFVQNVIMDFVTFSLEFLLMFQRLIYNQYLTSCSDPSAE